MKRPEKSSTSLVHGSYSPGIMQYTSPTCSAKNNFRVHTLAGRPYGYGHQTHSESTQQGTRH
ncbi:hypothetical protein [Spirosoma foliorum]|uniref:Uncharacterized protein n=1 Tax=Spirosoma foliorum TaxID=2710596 RepID=A0A7G5GMU5_9BACT|nr:hypothetical protein [Spirosoma foliorum]QMW00187.1 hypothetical protein H3H32_19355 [Spirosoma foliorum]